MERISPTITALIFSNMIELKKRGTKIYSTLLLLIVLLYIVVHSTYHTHKIYSLFKYI